SPSISSLALHPSPRVRASSSPLTETRRKSAVHCRCDFFRWNAAGCCFRRAVVFVQCRCRHREENRGSRSALSRVPPTLGRRASQPRTLRSSPSISNAANSCKRPPEREGIFLAGYIAEERKRRSILIVTAGSFWPSRVAALLVHRRLYLS